MFAWSQSEEQQDAPAAAPAPVPAPESTISSPEASEREHEPAAHTVVTKRRASYQQAIRKIDAHLSPRRAVPGDKGLEEVERLDTSPPPPAMSQDEEAAEVAALRTTLEVLDAEVRPLSDAECRVPSASWICSTPRCGHCRMPSAE